MTDTSRTQLRIFRGSIGHVLELYGSGDGSGSGFCYGDGYGDGYGYGIDHGYGYGSSNGFGFSSKRSDNGLVPLPDSNRDGE